MAVLAAFWAVFWAVVCCPFCAPDGITPFCMAGGCNPFWGPLAEGCCCATLPSPASNRNDIPTRASPLGIMGDFSSVIFLNGQQESAAVLHSQHIDSKT